MEKTIEVDIRVVRVLGKGLDGGCSENQEQDYRAAESTQKATLRVCH